MKCPRCNIGTLSEVKADEPWHDDYLICSQCDSTFQAGFIKNGEHASIQSLPQVFRKFIYDETKKFISQHPVETWDTEFDAGPEKTAVIPLVEGCNILLDTPDLIYILRMPNIDGEDLVVTMRIDNVNEIGQLENALL